MLEKTASLEAAAEDRGRAGREARAACPISSASAFLSEHYDVCDLCSMFQCAECVAEPEDLGWCDEPLPEGCADMEIPF